MQQEFLYNAEAQRNLTKNGQQLLASLNFFVSSVNTIVNKTMEDSLATVKMYETARIEYDAYRTDLEFYSSARDTEINQLRMAETQVRFNEKKTEFERKSTRENDMLFSKKYGMLKMLFESPMKKS